MDVRQLLDGAREALTVQRVFGEPFERNGTTVLPVARLQSSGGGGQGQEIEGSSGPSEDPVLRGIGSGGPRMSAVSSGAGSEGHADDQGAGVVAGSRGRARESIPGVAPGAAECPFEIRRPVMVQRWDSLTYLHWAYEPAVVQALLPPSLRVDVIDGAAWVGLIPFQMTVSLPGVPAVPWASRFLETNVRTYVHDRQGRSGIWFFSLDASRLGAVAVARVTYRLPYFWSRMRMTRHGDVIDYECRRRWPDRGPTSSVSVEVGAPYLDHELTAFDHWLTARWILFSRAGDRHRFARAWHQPWPLHRARVLRVDDRLVRAAGLTPPAGDAIAHHSPGVAVRIGLPEGDPRPS